MYPNQGQQQPNQGMYNAQQQQQAYYAQAGMQYQQTMQQQPQSPDQQMYDPNALSQQLQNQHLAGGGPLSPSGQMQGGMPFGAMSNGGANAQQRPRTAGSLGSVSRDDDYVTIQRNPDGYAPLTRERATATKLKIELFYKQNVQHALERNQRCVRVI
jgi:protein-serine/threonine kinase